MKKKHLNLQQKLMLSIFIVFWLPMACLSFYMVYSMEQNDYQKTVDYSSSMLQQIRTTLLERFSNAQTVAAGLANSAQLTTFLKSNWSDSKIVETINYTLRPDIMKYLTHDEFLKDIIIFHANPRIFDVYNILYHSDSLSEEAAWNGARGRRTIESIAYHACGRPFGRWNKRYEDVWYVSDIALGSSYSEMVGVIRVVIDNQVLMDHATEAFARSDEALRVYLTNGECIYQTGASCEALKSILRGAWYGADGALHMALEIPELGTTVVHTICDFKTNRVNERLGTLMAFAVLLLVAMLILTRLISFIILSKLNLLVSQMDGMRSGATPMQVSVVSDDEIGRLARHFNRMGARLTEAFQREKELLFDDLTNQLKPHFVLNALDMLRLQAEKCDQPDLSNSILLIDRYFRYAMMPLNKVTSLSDEIENAGNYMRLVNAMRVSKIVYDVKLDAWAEDNAGSMIFPRFLLQPILENTVRHGIRDKRIGYISLSIRYEAGLLHIAVKDNGQGMSAERLAEVRAVMRSGECMDEKRSGIGLRNMQKRMNLLFRDAYEVLIESKEQIGTTLELVIRLRKEHANGDCLDVKTE